MPKPETETQPETYGRCHCGAKVEMDPAYGTGYVGRFRDACEPCWTAAEEQKARDEWKEWVYDPEPAVFDADW